MLSKLNFSLTQLEYVLAVHKHGHFSKAAEACHVSQPTLSMQIQKFEEELGAVIFDRSKKPILLTKVGARIIDQIQSVIYEAKKFETLIQTDENTAQQGSLTLGVIPTISPYLLPRLLPVLENHFPNLELKISELQTERIIEALNNDEIDVGILATPLHQSKIFEVPLYNEPFSVLCHKNHEYAQMKKIKYSALKLDDIWLLEEGHCLRNQVLDVCTSKKSKKNKNYEFESGNLETLKNLVDLYDGYTLLPQLATDHIGSQSQIVNFEKPVPAREIGLVFRREHYKRHLIEALQEGILKSIPEELKKIKEKDLDILPITN